MYIDPNSGGMLFQVLLVVFGLLSGMVLIFSSRIKWAIARLKRSFREKTGEDADSEPESEPD
jgi:uncharacterized YccA/Bax inhibitor family protein